LKRNRPRTGATTSDEENESARNRSNSEEETTETTDGDGLTRHRFEYVTAMTPEEYLKHKRGIKDEVYGPDRR